MPPSGIKKMQDRPTDYFNTTFLTEHFSEIEDPRRTDRGNFKHSLPDILLLVLVSVLCRCPEWDDMSLLGKQQEEWFKMYGRFENGIPCGDTLRRVFERLDPAAFGACFSKWAASLLGDAFTGTVNLDGKTLRGARDKWDAGSAAPHLLNAMAGEAGICIGQVACGEKSNEITAIPELLRSLELGGCTVTIDAIGCQVEIAGAILDAGADYMLAVKGNRPGLLEAIMDTDRFEPPRDTEAWEDCGHGRVEGRTAKVWDNPSHLPNGHKWPGLQSFIKVEKTAYCKTTGKTTKEDRYYISSQVPTAKAANRTVRGHWAVENKLHWILDVTFGQDAQRKRKGHAPLNFDMVMKMAMALLNREKSFKASKNRKRLRALLDPEYRALLLEG